VVDMLAGLIQPSDNPFSSPVLLVKEKDDTFHFCVDYRHLNAITLKGNYHVPIIDEFLDELNGATWFSSLDLCLGFHQIQMNHEDTFKTTFKTHSCHYESSHVLWTHWSSSFISKGNELYLSTFIEKMCANIFYDILVSSETYDEHVHHLESVFQLLRQEHCCVKLSI
jgi:hypothetical protein